MVFKKLILFLGIMIVPACGLSELRIKSLEGPKVIETNKITVNWESSSIKMTRSLTDPALVNLNNKLYLIGGDTGSNWVANNNSYDFATEEWKLKGALKTRRSGHIAGVINDKIIVTGGFDGNQWLETAESYSESTNGFSTASPMFSKRSGLGGAVIDNKLYAVGGNFSKEDWSNQLSFYDQEDDSWQNLPEMKNKRTEVTAAGSNNKLYVFGGKNDTGTLDIVEEYNIEKRVWRNRKPMPLALTNAKAISSGDNILLIGGMDKDGEIVNSVNIYNVKLNEWYSGDQINIARMGFGITVIDNKIYIAGGTGNSGLLDSIEIGTIEIN